MWGHVEGSELRNLFRKRKANLTNRALVLTSWTWRFPVNQYDPYRSPEGRGLNLKSLRAFKWESRWKKYHPQSLLNESPRKWQQVGFESSFLSSHKLQYYPQIYQCACPKTPDGWGPMTLKEHQRGWCGLAKTSKLINPEPSSHRWILNLHHENFQDVSRSSKRSWVSLNSTKLHHAYV